MLKVMATYEHGILKPSQPLKLREHKKVILFIQSSSWQKKLQCLLKKVHSHTAQFSSRKIEEDITLARQEIKKIRHAPSKSCS